MKNKNFVTILRYLAKKSADIVNLCGANFFASCLVLFRTFDFPRLKIVGLYDAVA